MSRRQGTLPRGWGFSLNRVYYFHIFVVKYTPEYCR